MRIQPDNQFLQYSGRIDFDNPLKPEFVFAGTFVKMKYRGTCKGIYLSNHRSYFDNYMGYILDGKQGKFQLIETDEDTCYSLESTDFSDYEIHELMLFKRMDSCHTVTFEGFEVSEDFELLACEPLPERKIEVFGDSVSCGEVSEAVDCVGKPDPEANGAYSNSYYSYSWIAARKLHAELHITSQGGIALLDDTGWFHGPDYIGMETMYDKIRYNTEISPSKPWDFRLWKPDIVLLAFGQNDNNPVNHMKDDFDGEEARNWRQHYKSFILRLMEVYPGVTVILTTTILNHDRCWDDAIEMVCREMNHKQVHHFLYSNNGCGTPGHIRKPEAEKMAEELCGFIESLGDVWTEMEKL